MDLLTDAAYQWYLMLSRVGAPLQSGLDALLHSQSMPVVSALLLGLLGGLAPCQLSSNASAIAYVTQEDPQPGKLWRTVGAYIGGKAVVYLILGFLAAMLGLRLPVTAMALLRKLAGPLMVLVGLYLFGWIRWRPSGDGTRVGTWLTQRLPVSRSPAFWLGFAFSLAFCPTMAALFFAGLVPLVVEGQAGVVLPAFFAVGTALPVVIWAVALTAGREAAKRWLRGVRRSDRIVRWAAGAVFVLLGLNDTVLYWFT